MYKITIENQSTIWLLISQTNFSIHDDVLLRKDVTTDKFERHVINQVLLNIWKYGKERNKLIFSHFNNSRIGNVLLRHTKLKELIY